MKKLSSYINYKDINGITSILEYRTKGAVGKKNALQNVDMDKIEGKPAEKNGTGGKIEVDPPVDNSAAKGIDKETMSRNEKVVYRRMRNKRDFFIQGKAGWGKTSIIQSMAEKCGIPPANIIVMYLDKCEATDLGGIPIPVEGETKRGKRTYKQELLPPTFANRFDEAPDEQFLLFFDEMNQARPDVMNALMPIVLEHRIAGKDYDNFFVGAAGNYEDENSALEELSGPLLSRFGGIIEWEADTDDAWDGAFRHLHKKYDNQIAPEYLDFLRQHARLFVNPREIENEIIKRGVLACIKNDDNWDTDEWFDDFKMLSRAAREKRKLERSEEKDLMEVAEKTYMLVKNGGKSMSSAAEQKRKSREMFEEDFIKKMKKALERGFIIGDGEDQSQYGVSEENFVELASLVDDGDKYNGEMFERLLNNIKAQGVKPKFKTNKDFEGKYKDPFADD